LKQQGVKRFHGAVMSPSAWKEWIETLISAPNSLSLLSPSAWKEWIETHLASSYIRADQCLLPLGRSGLKQQDFALFF